MFLVFSLLFIFIHVVVLLVPLSRYQNFQRSVSNMLIWNMLTVGILFLSFTFSLVSQLLLLCSYPFSCLHPSPSSCLLITENFQHALVFSLVFHHLGSAFFLLPLSLPNNWWSCLCAIVNVDSLLFFWLPSWPPRFSSLLFSHLVPVRTSFLFSCSLSLIFCSSRL